jgi:hypothetical protein
MPRAAAATTSDMMALQQAAPLLLNASVEASSAPTSGPGGGPPPLLAQQLVAATTGPAVVVVQGQLLRTSASIQTFSDFDGLICDICADRDICCKHTCCWGLACASGCTQIAGQVLWHDNMKKAGIVVAPAFFMNQAGANLGAGACCGVGVALQFVNCCTTGNCLVFGFDNGMCRGHTIVGHSEQQMSLGECLCGHWEWCPKPNSDTCCQKCCPATPEVVHRAVVEQQVGVGFCYACATVSGNLAFPVICSHLIVSYREGCVYKRETLSAACIFCRMVYGRWQLEQILGLVSCAFPVINIYMHPFLYSWKPHTVYM